MAEAWAAAMALTPSSAMSGATSARDVAQHFVSLRRLDPARAKAELAKADAAGNLSPRGKTASVLPHSPSARVPLAAYQAKLMDTIVEREGTRNVT